MIRDLRQNVSSNDNEGVKNENPVQLSLSILRKTGLAELCFTLQMVMVL